jgi:uncharacterized membrane protein YhaH (DUF805 family)
MNWYVKVLKQYADFSGRARRTEYWMWTLFNLIIILALIGIAILFFIIGEKSENQGFMALGVGVYFIYLLYGLAVFIPSLAVAVRRLHDIGKSGWYYLIGLIPFAGMIILLIWFCSDSQPGVNEWGKNPKENEINHFDEM